MIPSEERESGLENMATLLPAVSQCLALSPRSLALKSTLCIEQCLLLNCTGFYFHVKLGRLKCLYDNAKEKICGYYFRFPC